MNALDEMKSMVERIVSEVLESRLGEIRAELVQRVEGELQPLFVQREGATALLNVAVNAVQSSVTQTDILNSVLDGSTNFAGRAILFVVRGDSAVAWNSRGFAEDSVRNLKLSATNGIAAEAARDANLRDVNAREVLGEAAVQPVLPSALLLPMKVRDKVPALLYADSGTNPPGRLDAHALQLLLKSAALWLEVIASRRGGQPGASVAPAVSQIAPSAAAEEAAAEMPPPPATAPEPSASAPASTPIGGAPESPPASGPDAEVHNRARRFAKLLVDEIVLYNQKKVEEGREHRDLYDRLRDDIEKSRAAYEKRYGSTAAAEADYFQRELIANLAANDPALLGSSFGG